MSIYINNHNGPIYEGCNVTINNGKEAYPQPYPEGKGETTEEAQEVDTSFFCTARFTAEIIEKNLAVGSELMSQSTGQSLTEIFFCVFHVPEPPFL